MLHLTPLCVCVSLCRKVVTSSGQLRWMAEESRDQKEAAVPPLRDRGQAEVDRVKCGLFSSK